MLSFKGYLLEEKIEEEKILLAYDIYNYMNMYLTEDINDKDEEDDEDGDEDEKLFAKPTDTEEDDDEDKKSKLIKDPIKNKDEEKEKKLFKNPVEDDKEGEDENLDDEKKADMWFKDVYDNIKKPNQVSANTLKNYKKSSVVSLGKIYAFTYDPIHKKKMKFYDEKPLVIPFELKISTNGKGFLGVNLHFLPRQQRAPIIKYFMNKNRVKTMKQGEMDVDYLKDIKHNTKFKLIYYCVRHYLYDRVVSDFFVVPQEDYVNVINLYSAKYVGMSEQQVINNLKDQSIKNIFNTPRMQSIRQKKELANQKRKEQMRAKAKSKINIVNNPEPKPKINGNL